MRWIFVFLVFLNIFFYIWQRQQIEQSSPTHDQNIAYVDHNIPSITLFKEQPIVENTITVQQEITQPVSEQKTDDTNIEHPENTHYPLTCLYLGGFTNQDQLTVITPYLEKIDKDINHTTIKLTETPKIHLYIIANNEEAQKALLEKLKQHTINGLAITRGAHKGDISLGLYQKESDYSALNEQLKPLELSITIENLPESANSYWIRVPNDKLPLFTPAILEQLTLQLSTMQQELMLCNLPEN